MPIRMKLTKAVADKATYPFDPTTDKRFVVWDDALRRPRLPLGMVKIRPKSDASDSSGA